MESADETVARARAALNRGDMFAAYDISSRDNGSADLELAYIRVLALARLGDWRSALQQYDEAGLEKLSDVDSLALKARLLKDRAFDSGLQDRPALLRQARDAYRKAFERTNEDFAAINAASLSFLAGDRNAADALARKLLDRSSGGDFESYWQGATRAEALLILGRFEEAESAIAEAVRLADANVAARSSTYRQFQRLLSYAALPPLEAKSLLSPIRPPAVAHYCGSLLAAGDPSEGRLATAIVEVLAEEEIGIAFGALACGADIIIAEQILAAGIELHVVFPFDRADFLRVSVSIGGEEWRQRLERCEAGAAAIYQASSMQFVEDDAQFAFGSLTAMGMARLRAARLHAETVQLAVTDDEIVRGVAGTAADVARWRDSGGRTRRIGTHGVARPGKSCVSRFSGGEVTARALRVLVFADFQGFSRLSEPVIPRFWQTVMSTCADALAPHADSILVSNTWGDGLHIVFDRVDHAAPALLDLSGRLSSLDLGELGSAGVSGMRIAAHFGSVYEIVDPITGRPNFYGSEVSRAARLEPVTPPGKVYITEPMAAAIEMTCRDRFRTRYVGRLALPKGFGIEPIYALERVEGAD